MRSIAQQDPRAPAQVKRLASMARELAIEAAKARFSKNFGSELCEGCDGLKAGPGVTATCFQMKQCYFDSFRSSDASPKQRRVIEALLGPPKKP